MYEDSKAVAMSGTAEKLLLRHVHAYVIRTEGGEELLHASDAQVESDPSAVPDAAC